MRPDLRFSLFPSRSHHFRHRLFPHSTHSRFSRRRFVFIEFSQSRRGPQRTHRLLAADAWLVSLPILGRSGEIFELSARARASRTPPGSWPGCDHALRHPSTLAARHPDSGALSSNVLSSTLTSQPKTHVAPSIHHGRLFQMVRRSHFSKLVNARALTVSQFRYNAKLAARPLLTQSVTTAVLFATGDITAQQLVEKKGLQKHDLTRTGRMALYGGCESPLRLGLRRLLPPTDVAPEGMNADLLLQASSDPSPRRGSASWPAASICATRASRRSPASAATRRSSRPS